MPRRILVVEDEPAFGEVLTELLVEEGYAVLQVRDGLTALNMLASPRRDFTPDMLICDVMLPGLRGDRLAAEVRGRFPKWHLPILLMSASADPHVQLSGVMFMSKPFETDELLNRVKNLLDGVMAA